MKRLFLALAAMCLLAGTAQAQDDDAGRWDDDDSRWLEELENRLAVAEASLAAQTVYWEVEQNSTCQYHLNKLMMYYREAEKLNEWYGANPTAEYQAQITEAKARNQEHLEYYRECFERSIARNFGDLSSSVKNRIPHYTDPITHEELLDVTVALGAQLPEEGEGTLEDYRDRLVAEIELMQDHTENYVGKIVRLIDVAEVCRDGQCFYAEKGTRLYLNDLIHTEPSADVCIELSDHYAPPGSYPKFTNVLGGSNTKVSDVAGLYPEERNLWGPDPYLWDSGEPTLDMLCSEPQ